MKKKLECAINGTSSQIPTHVANVSIACQMDGLALPHLTMRGGHVASLVKFHPVVEEDIA